MLLLPLSILQPGHWAQAAAFPVPYGTAHEFSRVRVLVGYVVWGTCSHKLHCCPRRPHVPSEPPQTNGEQTFCVTFLRSSSTSEADSGNIENATSKSRSALYNSR